MFVSDWMTTKVLTVGPDDSVASAMELIRDKRVKHIPVVKGARLVGIVSDTDIREYTPSRATSLDVYELNYLLAKAKVREIMKTEVVTVAASAPIEEAAMLLSDRDIGSLPVIEEGALVGIISDRDIFRALIDITGVRHGGYRIYLQVDDRAGSIREVADLVREAGFHIQGLLTSYEKVEPGKRKVVLRTHGDGDIAALRRRLEALHAGAVISGS